MNPEADLATLNTQHSSALERTLIFVLIKFRWGKWIHPFFFFFPVKILKVKIHSLDTCDSKFDVTDKKYFSLGTTALSDRTRIYSVFFFFFCRTGEVLYFRGLRLIKESWF